MPDPLPLDRLTPEEIAAWRAPKPAFDWKQYLPELRSIVWLISGLIAGAGGTVAVVPPKTVEVPGPKETIIREVPAAPKAMIDVSFVAGE